MNHIWKISLTTALLLSSTTRHIAGNEHPLTTQISMVRKAMDEYCDSSEDIRDAAEAIVEEANTNQFDPNYVLAVILNESHCKKRVRSPKGAIGMMQIMPQTGRYVAHRIGLHHYSHNDLCNARTNIKIGTAYLKELHTKYKSPARALTAYNSGIGREYSRYATKVLQTYAHLAQNRGSNG